MSPSRSWRRRLWREPRFWLVLQAVGVFAFTVARTDLETVAYRDSRGYVKVLERETLAQKLSHRRTPGYPLFLKAVEALPGGLARLPLVQLALYLGSVVAFGLAAGAYLESGWKALLVATPLFYVRLLPPFTAAMLADLPAASFALVAVAGLLAAAARPAKRSHRVLAWTAVGLGTFTAYQLRPAYLFLLPLAPLLGIVLFWLAGRRPAAASEAEQPAATRPSTWRLSARFTGLLAVIVLAPFLAWSAFRWAVTGHFGLVSFGGINLMGITGSMLTPEVVPRLPEEHRPLAQAMIDRRREVGYEIAPAYDFREWRRLYNANIFYIGMKAARALPGRQRGEVGGLWVDANRRFTGLSWALIRLQPGLYARWLRDATGVFVERMAASVMARVAALLLAVSVVAAALARALGRRLPKWAPRAGLPGPRGIGVALVSLAYAATATLLVVLVESPIDRYVFAAELLVPSGLVALGLDLWRPSPSA